MHRFRTVLSVSFLVLLVGTFVIIGRGVTIEDSSLNPSITSFDSAVQAYAQEHTPLPVAQVMLFATYLANTEVIIGINAILLIILILLKEELLASFFLSGLAIGQGLSLYFKSLLMRPRPLEVLYEVTHYGYSFPSGHAIGGIVFYGFLGYVLTAAAPKRWQKGVTIFLTTLIVFLIGYSRVALGVHWASDVIGGWLLGGAILLVLIMLYHVVEKRLAFSARHTKGIILIVCLLAIITIALIISYFYVTHADELRSIIKGS